MAAQTNLQKVCQLKESPILADMGVLAGQPGIQGPKSDTAGLTLIADVCKPADRSLELLSQFDLSNSMAEFCDINNNFKCVSCGSACSHTKKDGCCLACATSCDHVKLAGLYMRYVSVLDSRLGIPVPDFGNTQVKSSTKVEKVTFPERAESPRGISKFKKIKKFISQTFRSMPWLSFNYAS